MTNPKIAVCTTFPNDIWNVCAGEMLATFHENWPEDIKIYVQLDEMPAETYDALHNAIVKTVGSDRAYIAGQWADEQKAFIERWKDHKPESYMFDVVKFSHKVFALEKCADALKDTHDYLIWLDADVITKQKIDYEWLKEVLPGEDEVVSYLKRDGFYPECGWVAYNLKYHGYDLLRRMKGVYIGDIFKTADNSELNVSLEGWTDCHILELAMLRRRETMNAKNLSPFYEHGKTPIDVWPSSKLSERMVHRKGKRKYRKKAPDVVDVSDINIKTRNCLDHDKICSNVKQNLSQIRVWSSITKSSGEDLVICSAGPSLGDYCEEIKERQSKGAKVIAVKHAIDTLKTHKIKPWAVVLLDPREHVEKFVQEPDRDCFYFVSSMVDPSVVKTLNNHGCKVIGYHALVNAGEKELMIPGDLPVSGGSATSTRSIGLFADMFGFKNFHLYGYDLCHYQKPNMEEVNPDGNPKYIEINLGTHTYGGKYINRTFWTEGQFLAQANELRNLYKDRKDITITVHGDGLAGWQYKHHQAHQRFLHKYNENLERKRVGSPTLEEYVTGATRGSELSRDA